MQLRVGNIMSNVEHLPNSLRFVGHVASAVMRVSTKGAQSTHKRGYRHTHACMLCFHQHASIRPQVCLCENLHVCLPKIWHGEGVETVQLVYQRPSSGTALWKIILCVHMTIQWPHTSPTRLQIISHGAETLDRVDPMAFWGPD